MFLMCRPRRQDLRCGKLWDGGQRGCDNISYTQYRAKRDWLTIVDMFLTRSGAKDRCTLDGTCACRATLVRLGP